MSFYALQASDGFDDAFQPCELRHQPACLSDR